MSELPYIPRLDAMTTRWSLIQRAHGEQPTAANDARRVLVLRYAPVIKSYIRGITKDEIAADELSQDVVVRLMQGDFGGVDPGRGRFRDFLKTAIRNMVRNYWSREKIRSTADLDLISADIKDDSAGMEADAWDQRWKNRVLELTWSGLNQYEQQNPQSLAHTILQLRTGFPDDSSEQLAKRLSQELGKTIRPDAFRQSLRRARVQFAECLVQELADGLENPTREGIEEELIQLQFLDLVRDLLPADWPIGRL